MNVLSDNTGEQCQICSNFRESAAVHISFISVLQLLKRDLRLIFFTFICAEVQVLVSVCISQGVCVCLCVCVCVCACVCACVRACARACVRV